MSATTPPPFPLGSTPDAVNRLGLLSRELRRCAPGFHQHVFLGAFDLDIGQHDVLELLVTEYEHGCTMGALATAMRVTPPSATRAVDRLIERGLAVREKDAADRRRTLVQATPKGVELFRRHYEVGSPRFRSVILDEFEPEEIEAFVGYLERLVRVQDSAGQVD